MNAMNRNDGRPARSPFARLLGTLIAMSLFSAAAVSASIDADDKDAEKNDTASPVYVLMTTSKGDVYLELNREKAPITVENFVRYVEDEFYDGTIFHRVIADFMIQGGGMTPDMRQKQTRDPIRNEWQNGLRNERGTIAMARTTEPHSATAQFFINVQNNPNLDRPISDGAGYAVFGKVIHGMDVVDAIRKVDTGWRGPHSDVPVEPVVIEKVRVISKEDAERAGREKEDDQNEENREQKPDAEQPDAAAALDDAGGGAAASDPRAVELAEQVLDALGGREAWQQTRHFTWRFGTRRHVWDSHTGNVRIEVDDAEESEPLVLLFNINQSIDRMEGNVYRAGERAADDEVVRMGKQAWINDSYWLFMPYKMLDPGVQLRYLGERETNDNTAAYVVEMTFDDVGHTPQNKYHVYIDAQTRLVVQWDFSRHYAQDAPDFQLSWRNWKQYGGLMLSDDRGEAGPPMGEIGVANTLPDSVYREPGPVDWTLFTRAE